MEEQELDIIGAEEATPIYSAFSDNDFFPHWKINKKIMGKQIFTTVQF